MPPVQRLLIFAVVAIDCAAGAGAYFSWKFSGAGGVAQARPTGDRWGGLRPSLTKQRLAEADPRTHSLDFTTRRPQPV